MTQSRSESSRFQAGVLALVAVVILRSTARADMTLTPAAIAQGYSLSTFATNVPNDGSAGPVGIAFPGTGVMVSDFPGHVRVFPSHADGQDAASVSAVTYPFIDSTGIAELGGTFYMAQRGSGRVVQINPDGTFNQVIVTGLPFALGLVADPFTGHLFVSTSNAPSPAIYDVDPIAKTATLFVSVDADGLTLSGDGRTLYAAVARERILGFDTAGGAQVFDSGTISFVDGPALGIGSLAGKIFANVNDGTVWEVDLATGVQTLIASGGSRGDLVAVDPSDATLLLTQMDRILRLHGPPPCGGFGVASLQLAPPVATDAVGQTHTVTATATANGVPVAGLTVTDTVTGANATMGTCVTDGKGTCSFAYAGANVGTDTITASASPACGQTLTATATQAWCDAETSARIRIDGECDCGGASNHGAYVQCVAHAVKTSVKAGTLPKTFSGGVKRCAAKSTCGKSGFVTCCRTTARGVTRCSIKHGAAKCKAPKGGTAHVGNHASCCDACATSPCVAAEEGIAVD
jgi:hypothetical protein